MNVDGILELQERCRALEEQNQRLIGLFRHDDIEFRVVYKAGDKWYLSGQMYPGVNRESAIRIAEYERKRGVNVRIQIRTCSEWTDATDMKSIFHREGGNDASK